MNIITIKNNTAIKTSPFKTEYYSDYGTRDAVELSGRNATGHIPPRILRNLSSAARILSDNKPLMLKWSNDHVWRFSATPEGILYTQDKGTIWGFDTEGALLFQEKCPADYVISNILITRSGKLVAGDACGRIYCMDKNGHEEWRSRDNVDHRPSGMIESKDGTIYCLSENHQLSAVDAAGNVRWTFNARDLDRYHGTSSEVYSSPREGPDSTIYAGSHDCYFYAVTPGGKLNTIHHSAKAHIIPVSEKEKTLSGYQALNRCCHA